MMRVGLAIVLVAALAALLGPSLTPYDPSAHTLAQRLEPPSRSTAKAIRKGVWAPVRVRSKPACDFAMRFDASSRRTSVSRGTASC